jgi:hypothetical protein
MSRFRKAFSVSLLVWAHLQLAFAPLRHEISLASPVRIDLHNYIPMAIVAGCCFQAACEKLESNLIQWLKPKYVNLLRKFWLLLNWMAIGFRCVDFVPSYLSRPLDCITVIHTLRAILHLINLRFGLQVQERIVQRESWLNCRFVSKPYNPWAFSQRNNEVERLGFDAFKFIPFGLPPLHYYWYFVLVLSAVPIAIAISIWTGDNHILLSIWNLALLFAMVPVLSTAVTVILSSNQYSDSGKKSLIWFAFVMMNILFAFATIPMTHLAQFALEERSSHGWSNIK